MFESGQPYDLIRRPKPRLEGFYWEDIEFVPAEPSNPKPQQRPRIGRLGLYFGFTALLVAALRLSITSGSLPTEAPITVAGAAGEPETTGSVTPSLRPTLRD